MEEWKDIEGYEGYYQISSHGRVKSLKRCVFSSDGRKRTISEKFKKLTYDKDKYLICSLSKNGITSKKKVHRMVYTAFVGAIQDGCEINHKDFNRSNNRIDNLECVSHAENIKHTVINNRHHAGLGLYGDKNPNYGNKKLKLLYSNREIARKKQSRPGKQNGMCKPIRMIVEDGSVIYFDYIGECAKKIIELLDLEVNPVHLSTRISKCAKEGKKYKGYSFIFDNADDTVPSFHESD